MKVQNYTLESEIGAGSFSTVYKAYNREDGNYYAIKSMREMPRNVPSYLPRTKKLFRTKSTYSRKWPIRTSSATSLTSRKTESGTWCSNTVERETCASSKKNKVIDQVTQGGYPNSSAKIWRIALCRCWLCSIPIK